jgi:ABC-type polysaccharide/polyol phosphate transport system ATPase subunit
MSSELVGSIDIRDLVKTYRVGVGRARVREMLPPPVDRWVKALAPRWWVKDTFNALDGISLQVGAGSSVGIVGHNGAGKTTLLKLIAGVTSPTHGTAAVRGRIAALLDLLVGFNPDLTGRENAFMLAAMHGIGRREMSARIGAVLEFAEIDELADTPVKRYSAGMSARLGFAVITAIDPDILLVDEVLAVGDSSYQRKCMRWLDRYREQGGTLLFVSHNLGLVRNMTQEAVWIDHGKLVEQGETKSLLARYATAIERRDVEGIATKKEMGAFVRSRGLHRWGAGGARIEQVHIDDSSADGLIEVSLEYADCQMGRAIFCVGFLDASGRELGAAASPVVEGLVERGDVRWTIDALPFRPGIYFPVAAILSSDGTVLDRWRLDRALVIDTDVGGPDLEDFGPLDIGGGWRVASNLDAAEPGASLG